MSELSCLPYAVGHGQEGVCLTLHMGPHRILLDCGLASLESLPTAEPPADFVVCTHAHPDHSLGLLKFHQTWPHIPIFSSAATAALLPLNWPEVPLPQGADFCQRLPWRQEVALGEDLTLTLWPSGHLPGGGLRTTHLCPPRSQIHRLLHGRFFPLQWATGRGTSPR